jgi:hypothetical protein
MTGNDLSVANDATELQAHLCLSARQSLDTAVAAIPHLPPRFHWRGRARDAYADQLQILRGTLSAAQDAADHALASLRA